MWGEQACAGVPGTSSRMSESQAFLWSPPGGQVAALHSDILGLVGVCLQGVRLAILSGALCFAEEMAVD